MCQISKRASLAPSTAEGLLEYAYVRENRDFRCEDKVINCIHGQPRRTVYVNEMSQDELIRCESTHGACLSVKQAAALVNARQQWQYPLNSRDLAALIGSSVMDERIHFVFSVRNSQLSSSWLAGYKGEVLSAHAQARVEALLSDRYSLSSPEELITALSLPESRQAQFRSLVEMKTDLNTATLNEIGSRPPVRPNPWFLFWVVSFEYLGVGLGTGIRRVRRALESSAYRDAVRITHQYCGDSANLRECDDWHFGGKSRLSGVLSLMHGSRLTRYVFVVLGCTSSSKRGKSLGVSVRKYA